MSDYQELKRLAEAATPGPWKTNTAGSAKRGEPYKITEIYVYAPDTQDDTAICADVVDPVTQEPSEVNAAYISAASPDVVLGSLAEIDRLRTQNQALVKEMRYIAGISNGQVKRVADQALAALAQAEGGV